MRRVHVAEGLACDDIGQDSGADWGSPDNRTSPACEVVKEKCPEAVDGVTGPDLSNVSHPKTGDDAAPAGR